MEPPRRGLTDRFVRIVEAVRGLVASEALLDDEAVACGGGSGFSARLTKRGGAQASHASKATGLWPTRRAHMRPCRRSGLGRASVTLTPPTRVYVVLYLNQSSQLSVSRWARARIRPPDEADKCDFSLLFAGCAPCLFRLPAQKIGDDPINLRRGQQECGHSTRPVRFSMWLRQKFAQRRLGDFGPRSDLDEGRGRRVEDRRAALICGNDMAAGADLEREPAAGGDSPRLLPTRGNDPAKASARACAASNGFLIASSTVFGPEPTANRSRPYSASAIQESPLGSASAWLPGSVRAGRACTRLTRMLLRAVSAAMAKQGFLNERGRPFNHKSVATALAV